MCCEKSAFEMKKGVNRTKLTKNKQGLSISKHVNSGFTGSSKQLEMWVLLHQNFV